MPATSTAKVWVPRALATGFGGRLSKMHRLVYVALADRADNSTRQHVVVLTELAHRCGIKDPRTIAAAIEALVEVGVVRHIGDEKARVEIRPIKATARLELPLAAIWPGGDGPPRAGTGTATANALSAMLALIYFADFETGRCRVRHNTVIERIGGSKRQFQRDLAALKTLLGPQVMVQAHTHRSSGATDASEFTFVWEALPPYLTRSATQHLPEQIDPATTDPQITTARSISAHLYDLLTADAGTSASAIKRDLDGWIPAAVTMLDEGFDTEEIVHAIEWSLQDAFWQNRVNGMESISRNIETMLKQPEFKEWRRRLLLPGSGAPSSGGGGYISAVSPMSAIVDDESGEEVA